MSSLANLKRLRAQARAIEQQVKELTSNINRQISRAQASSIKVGHKQELTLLAWGSWLTMDVTYYAAIPATCDSPAEPESLEIDYLHGDDGQMLHELCQEYPDLWESLIDLALAAINEE